MNFLANFFAKPSRLDDALFGDSLRVARQGAHREDAEIAAREDASANDDSNDDTGEAPL